MSELDKKYIPFSLPTISDQEINEVAQVLQSGWLSTGPKTIQFEEEFAKYVGAKYAVGLTSCTAALHLALLANEIGPGDEVILPSLTFAACANMIVAVGATPIFAEISEDSYTLDIDDVEKKINKKTKAIIAVHYAGFACDIDALNRLAQKHQLAIIEDAAHAVGSGFRGKKIGSSDNVTCFSFYPTKTLTTGEGGMLTTNDERIAEYVKKARLHGISKDGWKRYEKGSPWRYDVEFPGWKYNMFDLQAAIGIHQLKKLDAFIEVRKKYAALYDRGLKKIKALILPPKSRDVDHSYHLYAVRVKNGKRDELIEKLSKENIGTSVHFIPNHTQSFYREKYGYKIGDLPITEKISNEILSLPLYPGMTEGDIDRVVKALEKNLKI